MVQQISNDRKNSLSQWVLTPEIEFWKFRNPFGIPILTMGVHLGVWGFIRSHYLHSREHVMWLLGLSLGPCRNLSLGLMTKARGLQGYGPRGTPGSRITCSRECKECEGMNPHTHKWIPVLGVGVSNGLPNFQSVIAGVKIHCLEKFFISLKSYWSVDV
jgi:hypothetical protein